MKSSSDTGKEKLRCEICGKAGSSIVMLGQKGSDHADFYWICEHCEKAVRWAFARIEDAKKEECENKLEENNEQFCSCQTARL